MALSVRRGCKLLERAVALRLEPEARPVRGRRRDRGVIPVGAPQEVAALQALEVRIARVEVVGRTLPCARPCSLGRLGLSSQRGWETDEDRDGNERRQERGPAEPPSASCQRADRSERQRSDTAGDRHPGGCSERSPRRGPGVDRPLACGFDDSGSGGARSHGLAHRRGAPARHVARRLVEQRDPVARDAERALLPPGGGARPGASPRALAPRGADPVEEDGRHVAQPLSAPPSPVPRRNERWKIRKAAIGTRQAMRIGRGSGRRRGFRLRHAGEHGRSDNGLQISNKNVQVLDNHHE